MSIELALKILELNDDFTEKEFKTNYWRLAKKNHPDNNTNTEDSMKKINEAKIVIEKILKKRELKETIDEFLNQLNKIKIKYQNTQLYDVACNYQNELSNLDDISDIKTLKDNFYIEINKLKKEIILPIEKEKLLKKISKYQNNHIKEIILLENKYHVLINEATSLEELNTLKQKFSNQLKKLLLIEREKIKEYDLFKEKIKNTLISYFYNNSINQNIENIVLNNKLLMKSLMLLNNSDYDNIYDIYEIIKNIDYNDISKGIDRIEKILNDQYGIKTLNNYEISYNEENDLSEYYQILLDSYCNYLTKKNITIDKILNEENYFVELINIINNLEMKNLNMSFKYLKNVTFKNMKVILNNIRDFYDPSKVYIERDTGNICIIEEYNKKIWTIYLDGRVENNITEKKDVFWKFISIMNFFRIAEFTNGSILNEVKKDDVLTIYNSNVVDLYFTGDLLLRRNINSDNNSFKFIPAVKGYKYALGDSDQMIDNSKIKEFADRGNCMMEVMLSISKIENIDNIKKNI